jgi:hypothetical protein
MGGFLLSAVRRPRTIPTILEGIGMALKTMATNWKTRRPVRAARYRLWLRLRRERTVALSDVLNDPAFRQGNV